MSVTAKLSCKFYETFGDEIANELVEWFNQVDTTYRTELREVNELNFARFDAKLEQRIAELRAELATLEGRLLARLGVVEGRFGTLEGRLVRWMFLFWVASLSTSIAPIAREHRVGFQHRLGEYRHELVPRERVPPGELGAAIADVGRPADAAHDPLADVAGQVQHQVADAVGRLIGAPPGVFLGQPLDGGPDLGQVMAGQVLPGHG